MPTPLLDESNPREIQGLFRRLLKEGHTVQLKAVGPCMAPLIKDVAYLRVAPVPFSSVKIGDIAVYGEASDPQGLLTAHRVVKKVEGNRPFLITCGDAEDLRVAATFVYSENYYGKVVAIEQGEKRVLLTNRWIQFGGKYRAYQKRARAWILKSVMRTLRTQAENALALGLTKRPLEKTPPQRNEN